VSVRVPLLGGVSLGLLEWFSPLYGNNGVLQLPLLFNNASRLGFTFVQE
jgi:hypothetical protein